MRITSECSHIETEMGTSIREYGKSLHIRLKGKPGEIIIERQEGGVFVEIWADGDISGPWEKVGASYAWLGGERNA